MKNTAHTGHEGNSGIQNHSCGPHYPVVVSMVGGYPRPENDNYYKLLHPNGTTVNVYRAANIGVWVDYLKRVDKLASTLYRLTTENGGGSVREDGNGYVRINPCTGYVASIEDSEVTVSADKFSVKYCAEFIIRNELTNCTDYYGGWVDDGIVYLDVSRRFSDRVECLVFAAENNQLAYFNCERAETVYL